VIKRVFLLKLHHNQTDRETNTQRQRDRQTQRHRQRDEQSRPYVLLCLAGLICGKTHRDRQRDKETERNSKLLQDR